MLVTDQSDGGMDVRARIRIGKTGVYPPPSGDDRRGVVVIDHATVRGGVWAAARWRGTPFVFDLQPGFAERLGKVVIHWARDGHRVGGGGLGLLVVFPKAATEMFLNHRVAHCVGLCKKKRKKRVLVTILVKKTTKKTKIQRNSQQAICFNVHASLLFYCRFSF